MSDKDRREAKDEAETEGHGRKLGGAPHEFGAKPEDSDGDEVAGHGKKLGPLGQGIWAKPDEEKAESRTE